MLIGIFVGGRARRMGGIAKGLLPAPSTGEPLAARLARIAHELGHEPVLVGDAPAYREALPGLRAIADDPVGVGPLGGLGGLLAAADDGLVIALSCDLPHVSPALLGRLATTPSTAAVLAPRATSGVWEPLCARYDAAAVRPALVAALARGERSFQRLFAAVRVEALPLDDAERAQLVDWDAPEDLTR